MVSPIFILFLLNQLIAGTHILVAVSDFTYEYALLISASVVLIYLILGGFKSVVKTDVFQYLVFFFLVVLIGFNMFFSSGGSFVDNSIDTGTIIPNI